MSSEVIPGTYDLIRQFNPVPLALELLDDSSLGRDLVAFEKLLSTLNTTVEDVVNGNL